MKHYEVPTVSHETALEIIRIGFEEGYKLGINMSIAVVDPGMNLVAFAKADGATPHSAETSRRKANSAASTRKETGWMPVDLELKLSLAANNKLTNIPGGHPIMIDKKVIGGVGVAGGTVEQDAQVADAIMIHLAE